MVQKEILSVVADAGIERTMKAVQGLTSGDFQVTITAQDERGVAGLVEHKSVYKAVVGFC